MWEPKHLIIKNLWAHVDTQYEFTNGVCTVVFGENRDDEDSDNNGAGKSTLFEAVAIALTGKSLRDIDKEVFINHEADNCEVEFYLENSVLNKMLGIVRKFYRGSKSAKVEIYEDGERNTQLVSVNEANARIVELLGITREDLTRYFIISQDSRYQFFTAGDVEKKEVLNRITNAEMINPILEKLSEDKKRLTARSSEIEVEIAKYTNKLEFYREQRAEAKKTNNEDEIQNKENEIKDLEQKKKKLTKDLEALNIDLGLKRALYEELNKSIPDVSKYIEKSLKLKKKIKELEQEQYEADKIIRELKADISGAIKCPECGFDFIPESNYNLSLEEAKQLIKDTEGRKQEILSLIKDKKAKLVDCNAKIDKADEVTVKADAKKRVVKSIEGTIQDVHYQVERCCKKISNLKKEIEEIKKNNQNKKIVDDCNAKIAQVKKALIPITEEQKRVKEELSMVEYWSYYMGKNGFATYLANKAVSIIEGVVNSFLKKFHSSMTVEINGFKINKDGSVRDKIDVLAVYKGKYAQNFMGYSGGERSRMYLASILGIQHLINLSADGKGLDLLMLDESLGALDSRGVVNICNILNSLGVTTLMITQNVSNDVNVSNKILVVREDEVSKIMN